MRNFFRIQLGSCLVGENLLEVLKTGAAMALGCDSNAILDRSLDGPLLSILDFDLRNEQY